MAILGQIVHGPDGKEVGRLVDVLVNAAGQPIAAVLDVGGFLGIGNRKIAVDWKTLHFAPAEKGHAITLEMSADQIRVAPEYRETKPAPVVTPTISEPSPAHPGEPAAAESTPSHTEPPPPAGAESPSVPAPAASE
jgi:hypothetical protein